MGGVKREARCGDARWRSAELHSAVSRIFNPPGAAKCGRTPDSKPAIQPIKNLRDCRCNAATR